MKPKSFVSSCSFRPGSVITANRPEYIWPALFTRMSTAPKRRFADSTRRATSDSCVMSATSASTSPPVSPASLCFAASS